MEVVELPSSGKGMDFLDSWGSAGRTPGALAPVRGPLDKGLHVLLVEGAHVQVPVRAEAHEVGHLRSIAVGGLGGQLVNSVLAVGGGPGGSGKRAVPYGVQVGVE